MSGSLEQRTFRFDGLRWSQVIALIDVLRESELRNEDHIEKRYRGRAPRFDQTIAFLTRVGVVTRSKGAIRGLTTYMGSIGDDLHVIVLDGIMSSPNAYRAELIRYLNRYTLSNGEAFYRPNVNARSKESGVRNFLMEMGIVRHDKGNDRYLLEPEHIGLYMQAHLNRKAVPPSRITSDAAGREAIGLDAEKTVVRYERNRLGEDFSDCVKHVALNNAGAGFDVLSATVISSVSRSPRYIEVKAVSERSLQFHWTQNEIDTARLLTNLYYLYLVPVGSGGQFSMDRIQIISNPYAEVFGRGSGWGIEPGIVLCRPPRNFAREVD